MVGVCLFPVISQEPQIVMLIKECANEALVFLYVGYLAHSMFYKSYHSKMN